MFQVTEIASRIFTKRELDCKARDITFVEERERDPEKLRGAKKLYKVLNGNIDDEIRGKNRLTATGNPKNALGFASPSPPPSFPPLSSSSLFAARSVFFSKTLAVLMFLRCRCYSQ